MPHGHFAACQALDLPAAADALERGAATRATDANNHRGFGVMLNAWRANRHRPVPDPFIELLAQHEANLDRPGGEGTPHTLVWLSLTDRDVRLFEALENAGMELGGTDEAALLRRVVLNKAPRLLEAVLYSGFDVDAEACDDDNRTALHALVDTRLQERSRMPGKAIVSMMQMLVERGALGQQPDICNRTASDRMARETPELFGVWQAMRALRDRELFELRMPDEDDDERDHAPTARKRL